MALRTAAIAVRRGRPWVYREGLARGGPKLTTGALVELVDEAGEPLGRALADADSPIALRIVGAPTDRGDLVALYATRLREAIARRADFDDRTTTAYRVVNGEGDRAPGLVVDRYAHVAVLKLDTPALEPHLDGLVKALESLLSPRGVRSIALRVDADAKGSKLATLAGDAPPNELDVLEHGMTLEVDLARGQKTGAFLDQRENRARVRSWSRGRKSVLNLFSYSGGFSVAAALGGAERVVSVDVAAGAHATAQRTFRKNGLDPSKHAFVTADVFAYLEGAKKKGERFDLVISDPPSFAPSERAKERASAAYRKLHAAARAVLAPGGLFCAASCSSHVTMEDFLATLDDQALGPGLSAVETHGNPADHPTLAGWPEGRYLKLVLLR